MVGCIKPIQRYYRYRSITNLQRQRANKIGKSQNTY
ncbi:unnamed protein product [Paramecium sonneborni]|uniref:Uncharacterized protein n=1 Tax=Paramecium sonneborni TaxID=65129 RepID=A0A8S1KE76_9CILI|nr:unnamed protein product [Paramecium sonneborni]